jgi:hypothetical protein
MKSLKLTATTILFLLTVLTACKKTEVLPYNPSLYSASKKGNFEAFWDGINNGYVTLPIGIRFITNTNLKLTKTLLKTNFLKYLKA